MPIASCFSVTPKSLVQVTFFQRSAIQSLTWRKAAALTVLSTASIIFSIWPLPSTAQGGTWIIPNHGRLSDTGDVASYRNMLAMIRDRVQDMVKKGMTLEQVKAARPTMDFDGRYGSNTGSWTTAMFVEAVYRSLKEKK